MANDTLGLNISFPIYGEDGLPFHDLIINKSSYESTAMSLEEKISGDFYYKDNTLSFSMKEYVEYNGIHYVLVNPPTIVREGLVSDNSEAKGMTKYSVVFYHPMYLLSNLPFSDVAVRADEVKYLSENKKFSWIGYPDDYIAKLNKNLQNTQWIVVKSSRFPTEKNKELSEVLSFDNNTIADALSTWHDTWKLPFVVDKVNEDEEMYATGKRFKIVMGMASNEIYASDTDRETPFVFHMGQGVGLKNNSRTPRNNKIVTRISGYGSENNIPFGYPQIRWYGDSRWDYTEYEGNTIHYDDKGKVTNTPKASAYPLYKGILGGEYVKLIKHPFTRNHLMPSIYRDTLFNKVSPYDEEGNINENYNPNIELVDYYDAVYSEEYPYVNTINVQAPNFEIHEFDEIKPELDADRAIGLIKVLPLNDDLSVADKWIDDMDENGKYEQSYFSVQLPRLDFDLYACANITEEMQINMRSGACIGCTFPIQVDWDDYKLNFYDSEGNFAPNGAQRNLDKYPKSNLGSISIIVKKESSTFGTVMPNVYQYPQSGDKFVFLGISLPESYITNAEVRLDKAMKSYMLENNVYYFDYPLKFDEFFLKENVNILRQIRPNTIIRFEFNNEELSLSVKQIAINYGSAVLPQYNITLTDNVEVSMNAIGQVADDVENLSTMLSVLREEYDNNVWKQILSKLSKTDDDKAAGVITFLKGILFGDTNYGIDEKGKANLLSLLSQSINNTGKIVTKDLTVSGVLDVFQLVIDKIKAASGGLIISPADGFTVDVVEDNHQSLDGDIFRTSFISNPNNGYIDTGVVPTNNTRIKARVRFTRPLSGDLQVLYGATADNVDEYFDVDYYNGKIIYNYDSTKMAITVDDDTNVTIVSDDLSYPYLLGITNGESASKLLVNFGDIYDDTLDNEEGSITIDQSLSGITVGSATKAIDFAHLDVENLSKTLYLFANNGIEGADSFCHNVEILDLKIYEGEQVIRDYCPASYSVMRPHHTPVTVYGLFDRINHEFKQSEGDAFGGSDIILPATYTLYWRATDSNGNQRGNMWQVGDQALCQSFNNAVVGQTRETSNKKYWSLVTSVSDYNNPIEVTLPNGTSAPCHYITISMNDYAGTLAPTIGDDIVMLGNRSNTNRQFAIYLSAYDSLDTGYSGDGQVISGINAPLLAFYEGINDFNLSKHRTTFFANGDNAIVGNVKITSSGQKVSVEKYISDTIDDKAPYIGNDGYWYVWDATTSSYKKNIKAEGENGRNGQDGVTVLNTYTKYSTNHGNVQPNKATFTLDSIGATTLGDYIWSLQTTVYSDGKTSEVYSVSRIGENGINGANGKDGIDGKDGANGKDGIDGKDGANGKDGIDGKDAEYDKIDVSKSIAEVSYSEQSKDVLSYSIEGKILKVVGDRLLTPTPSDYQLILRPSNYPNGSHDINITIGQDCTFTATNNSYMSNYSKAQSRPTAFILILKKKNNDNTYSIIDNYVINVSAPPVATMTLDGEINLRVSDLTNSLNDAGINIALGKITLNAANTEVTGNLIFNGFVTPKMVHITNENLDNYGTRYGSYYFFLDFSKCGTLISWEVTTYRYVYVNMPHIDEHTADFTDEQRDDIRSYIGTTINIYNNSNCNFVMRYLWGGDIEHEIVPNTSNVVERGNYTAYDISDAVLIKGDFASLHCEVTLLDNKETVGWKLNKKGTADNVSNE